VPPIKTVNIFITEEYEAKIWEIGISHLKVREGFLGFVMARPTHLVYYNGAFTFCYE
jgi:hypothetical protein